MPSKPRTLAGILRTRRLADAEYNRAQRDPATARIHGSSRWRAVSARVLRDEPVCRHCARAGLTEPATQVDHIVGLALAPDRAFDPTNLQPLCTACHARKSTAERTGHPDPNDARAGHQRAHDGCPVDDLDPTHDGVGGPSTSHASRPTSGARGVSQFSRVSASDALASVRLSAHARARDGVV